MTAGLVVAGGFSTRFGIDEKALVPVDGDPMLVRVVRSLLPVVDDVVIDCRADQVAPFRRALEDEDADPRFAVDQAPDRGPIAGLANGLAAIEADETVVLSCDRPGVTPALLEQLRTRRRNEAASAAVPSIDGFLQPLCGVYETDALRSAAAEAIATAERRLCSLPHSLAAHVMTDWALAEVVSPGAIESVDTPLEARLWSESESNPRPAESSSGAEATRQAASD